MNKSREIKSAVSYCDMSKCKKDFNIKIITRKMYIYKIGLLFLFARDVPGTSAGFPVFVSWQSFGATS